MKSLALRTLGRSGLLVSPLALGTMTFGTPAWGSPDDDSASIFDAYVESGGNFIDMADVYADGRSEELVGGYIAERGLRDRLVLATKFSFDGGNGRKNIYRALEGSLRRLLTDYIDLYWLHTWDRITPVDEVLQSLGDLVRAGKIRYFGLSDVPAWYAAKAATLAQAHALPGPIALQLEYSLIERNIEREHLPAARECGLGICAWSPLAGGFLAGKYQREGATVRGNGRLDTQTGGNNRFAGLDDQNWKTLDPLRVVAAQVERPVAQVALAWALAEPAMTSLIVGATKPEQLRESLGCADFTLSVDQRKMLDDVGAPMMGFPYTIFSDEISRGIFDGATVRGWP